MRVRTFLIIALVLVVLFGILVFWDANKELLAQQFERLRVEDEECALSCPTIRDVSEAHELRYFEESVSMEDHTQVLFGGAVIPLEGASEDAAAAVLLLRRKDALADDAAFRDKLLEDAAALYKRILPHL